MNLVWFVHITDLHGFIASNILPMTIGHGPPSFVRYVFPGNALSWSMEYLKATAHNFAMSYSIYIHTHTYNIYIHTYIITHSTTESLPALLLSTADFGWLKPHVGCGCCLEHVLPSFQLMNLPPTITAIQKVKRTHIRYLTFEWFPQVPVPCGQLNSYSLIHLRKNMQNHDYKPVLWLENQGEHPKTRNSYIYPLVI